jgi:hypothetical protein
MIPASAVKFSCVKPEGGLERPQGQELRAPRRHITDPLKQDNYLSNFSKILFIAYRLLQLKHFVVSGVSPEDVGTVARLILNSCLFIIHDHLPTSLRTIGLEPL